MIEGDKVEPAEFEEAIQRLPVYTEALNRLKNTTRGYSGIFREEWFDDEGAQKFTISFPDVRTGATWLEMAHGNWGVEGDLHAPVSTLRETATLACTLSSEAAERITSGRVMRFEKEG